MNRVTQESQIADFPNRLLALATATLVFNPSGGATLANFTVIWRQMPKIVSFPGSGEPGGKMTFSPDLKYLFLTSGDRQELDIPFLFSLNNTLGKIIRLFPDGSIPTDNPFVGHSGALPEIWTLGHRNQYGLAFGPDGLLWEHEHGPAGGDEFNLIQPGNNYGWPAVSYGNTYTGELYPKPAPGDGYAMSAIQWTPAIAPSAMIFYSGTMFAAWKGDAIITGLQSQGLVRVHASGTSATEVQRVSLGTRIRSVVQGPDGALWVLEDAGSGRLLKLAPTF